MISIHKGIGRLSLLNEIGRGVYGTVHRALYIPDVENTEFIPSVVAVKRVPVTAKRFGREVSNSGSICREVNGLRKINEYYQIRHRPLTNVINFIDSHLDVETQTAYIITDIGEHGSLSSRMYSNHPVHTQLRKAMTRLTRLHVIHDILCGIAECHEAGFAHCDIKPGNIVNAGVSDVLPRWKLVDLGNAQPCDSQYEGLNAQRMTPFYAAPEIIKCKNYGKNVDIWALGIIAYAMFCHGKHPMTSNADNLYYGVSVASSTATSKVPKYKNADMYEMITRGSVFLGELESTNDVFLHDFIRKCLCIDPRERMDAESALRHPLWEDPAA